MSSTQVLNVVPTPTHLVLKFSSLIRNYVNIHTYISSGTNAAYVRIIADSGGQVCGFLLAEIAGSNPAKFVCFVSCMLYG